MGQTKILQGNQKILWDSMKMKRNTTQSNLWDTAKAYYLEGNL